MTRTETQIELQDISAQIARLLGRKAALQCRLLKEEEEAELPLNRPGWPIQRKSPSAWAITISSSARMAV